MFSLLIATARLPSCCFVQLRGLPFVQNTSYVQQNGPADYPPPPQKTVMIHTPIGDERECLLFYPVINWVLPLKKKNSVTIQLKKKVLF